MRRLCLFVCQIATHMPPGSAAIAAGLAILAAAMLWPGVPAVTALSLVVLGATDATLARFRGKAVILPIALTHLFIYGSLYALFVGAALHAASHWGAGLNALAILDLAFSICPLAVALERVWCEMHVGRSSE
jgi:hypothetical protein